MTSVLMLSTKFLRAISQSTTLSPMAWFRTLPRSLLWLACVALLVARIGGAHLHVCLDGTEAPVSFHTSISEPYSDHDGSAQFYSDWDLSLFGDVVAKKVDNGIDAIMPRLGIALLLILPLTKLVLIPHNPQRPISLTRARRFRPPLQRITDSFELAL